jgi:hypothetical protein
MTFDGVSPTQQYLIDNAVMYGGYTPEEAFAEIVGTTPTASIENIGTTYSGGPTQTNFPTNVYMNPEVVVNSGDATTPTFEQEEVYTDDVTKDITIVDGWSIDKGLIGTEAGGLLDRGLQIYSPQYQALRAIQGYFDEKYEAGTPTETIKNISNWWDDVELPEWMTGLAAQNVPTGSGLFGESLDEGSYTDMGSYSYGTIDGIGVEDPN